MNSDSASYDLKWLKACFEVDERIRIARSADEAVLTNEEVRRRIGQLINYHPFFPVRRTLYTRLFRARPNDPGTAFGNVRDLWYPPKDKAPLGRFTQPNRPRLYLTGSGAIAVAEVGLLEKQKYTIAEFVFARVPACQMLGMRHSNSNALRSLDVDLSGRAGHPAIHHIRSRPTTSHAFDKVEEYFEELATRSCSEDSKHRFHRPSAALADMLFNRGDVDGIMYPAQKSLYCATNYCLSSDFVDQWGRIVKVWEVELFRFSKSESKGYLTWALTGCSENISQDGTIDWHSFPKNSTILGELHDLGFEEDAPEIMFGPYAGRDGYEKLMKNLASDE